MTDKRQNTTNNVFVLNFHCPVIMVVISHELCSFEIEAHESSPVLSRMRFYIMYSTLSPYLLSKIILSLRNGDSAKVQLCVIFASFYFIIFVFDSPLCTLIRVM